MTKISIIDYNAGNMGSIYKAIKALGIDTIISNKIDTILDSDGIILPGVGAFGECMENFQKAGFIENNLFGSIMKDKIPFLGICLGQQMLFDESEEMGLHKGLGIIKGRVIRFPQDVKCPQIGWNNIVKKKSEHFIFDGVPDNTYFYFVHSFHVTCENSENILAETDYNGTKFPSMVIKDNIIACQFHPEKSGKMGQKMLRNFISNLKK